MVDTQVLDNKLELLQKQLRERSPESLRAEIEQAVLARRSTPGAHLQWALLCEEADLMSLAFSEFQLALREQPDDPIAAFRLAQHYRDRGEAARAIELLAQLLEQNPACEAWLSVYVELLREERAEPRIDAALRCATEHGLPEGVAQRLRRGGPRRGAPVAEESPSGAAGPTDADCLRFLILFGGREGVHARQWARPNGETGYSPVHEPLTPALIRNHLLGTYTLGVYPIRLDGTASFLALDLDIEKPALERAQGDPDFANNLRNVLRQEGPRLAGVLHDLGLPALLENSGYKGRHLWVFLEEPTSAQLLHELGTLFLTWQSTQVPPGLHLEFFPKQPALTKKGLGNLIKLPLGVHRRTGRWSQLLDEGSAVVAEPFERLRGQSLVPRHALAAALERLRALAPATGAPCGATGRESGGDAATTGDTHAEARAAVFAPPPPAPPPAWTEADFEADRGVGHLLAECPVLAEVKRTVDEHRRLSHEEQLVLINTLGHLEGGPQAVNYLFQKCLDVGPEMYLQDRLKGSPVSCPSIRRKIPHITRRVTCQCAFPFAADRYPTPVLYLLTAPAAKLPTGATARDAPLVTLAERFGVLERRRAEIEEEWRTLRSALVAELQRRPERVVVCPGGRYCLLESDGVEELKWESETPEPPV